MVNTFDWIEIKTRDIERAANFYENLFGWKILQKMIITLKTQSQYQKKQKARKMYLSMAI